MFPKGEGVVRPEADPLWTQELNQAAEDLRIVNEGVDPKLPQLGSGALRGV